MLVEQKSQYRSVTKDDYAAMAGPDWPSYKDFALGVAVEKFVADELDAMLGSIADKKSKLSNFCVLPFYGKEYPGNIHCCLLPKHYDIEKIQRTMLNGDRSPECSKCWKLEDAGQLSDRQIKNFTLDYYTNTDITHLFDQAQSGTSCVSHYKISAGNYCNATCVTCGDDSSTAWGDLLKSTKTVNPLIMLKQHSKNIEIEYATAQFIGFAGGESTMIRTHWDILESLVDANNTSCCISFTTNGSFDLNQRQKNLLSKFENVNFNFSIDGVGAVFEYLRYPVSWSKLNQNIDWARKQNYKISSTYTISNLNIYYHDQTVKWFADNDIRYLENPVYDPAHFAPQSLPESIKQKILQSSNLSLTQSVLSQHSSNDDNNYQECLKQIQFQDQLKNIHIQDYLPEFWELVKSH
jgi:hypothetical protein